MSDIKKNSNTRRRWLVTLSCLLLMVVGVTLAVKLRSPNLVQLRKSMIAMCEASEEPHQSETGLPRFNLSSSHQFKDVDGRQYEAFVFQQQVFIYPDDSRIKVVIVDKNYSVVQSKVVTIVYRKTLTGKNKLVHHSDGLQLKVGLVNDFMSPMPTQLIIPISPKLQKGHLQEDESGLNDT